MDTLPPPLPPPNSPLPSSESPEPGAFGPVPGPQRRWIRIAVPVAVALIVGILVAVLARPDDQSADAAEGPTTSSSPSVEPLSPPENPRARAKPFRIALTWSDEDPTDDNDGYEIRRNGTWVGDVEAGVTRFVDEGAIPGGNFTYEIRTQSLDGRYSEPISIEVSTPLPPRSAARVAGIFDVRADVTSSYGISGYEDVTFGWRLTPSCDDRACGFRLSDTVNDITVVSKRKGGTYTAPFTGRLGISCGDAPVTSSGTVELRVKTAKVIGGEWRATRLVGTMSHSETAQLGCRSSGATLSLNAKLVRLAG